MKNQFLYSWWVKGDALPLKWISIALHEKMNFLLFAFFFEWKKTDIILSLVVCNYHNTTGFMENKFLETNFD